MFDFVRAGGDFLFLSPCTLHDLDDATTSPSVDVPSSRPLRLHVDWGFERHGYSCVPTNQGSRGLSSGPDLPKAPQNWKWAQRPYPQLRRPWKTPEDLIQIPGDPLGL
jgi:hypothetical protein